MLQSLTVSAQLEKERSLKSRITKFVVTAVAATALAVPAVASAASVHAPGEAPAAAHENSCNSGHGAFGFLGEHGERHDLGQGDTMGDGVLGASPLTGPTNSGAAQACREIKQAG